LLPLAELSLNLKANAVQGCWGDESSLMMLPNMTPEGFSQLASKGFQAVPQLCQAASENAANLRSTLTAVLGSSRESSEVMQVGLLTIPCACCFAVHLCLLLLCVMHFKRNVLNVEMRLEVPATYVWLVHHLTDIIGKVIYLHVLIQIFAMRQHHHCLCQQAQSLGVLELLCVHIN
jgi:hypothetical protein